MSKTLSYAAVATILALAGPAFAQSAAPSKAAPMPQAAPPVSSSPAPTAAPPSSTAPATSTAPAAATPPSSAASPTGTDAAANAGASTTLTSGMSVKDNTGALIGEVKSVKGGVATIQMGSDTFSVDSSKLGVANGAVTINATQAELKKMLPAKK